MDCLTAWQGGCRKDGHRLSGLYRTETSGVLQQPAMIMAAAGLLQLAALVVLVRMRLLGPVLKFTGFVLIAGIVRLMVAAIRESMRW